MYAERGFQETGRLLVWPIAIQRFMQVPLTGVGISDIPTYIPSAEAYVTPHNAYIFTALASGVLPLSLLILYWVWLLFTGIRINGASNEDAPFQTSLLLYSFMIMMYLNEPFKAPWMMTTFASVMSSGYLQSARRAVADAVRRQEILGAPGVVRARTG